MQLARHVTQPAFSEFLTKLLPLSILKSVIHVHIYVRMYVAVYYTFTYLSSCRHATFSECPAPPELSEDDINSVHDLAGPLESDNTYVAEHLLRRAGDELPSVFFRRVQAGFVFGYDEHMDLSCLSSASPQYDFPSESDIPSQSDIPDIPSQIFSPTMENLTATIWYNNQVR